MVLWEEKDFILCHNFGIGFEIRNWYIAESLQSIRMRNKANASEAPPNSDIAVAVKPLILENPGEVKIKKISINRSITSKNKTQVTYIIKYKNKRKCINKNTKWHLIVL